MEREVEPKVIRPQPEIVGQLEQWSNFGDDLKKNGFSKRGIRPIRRAFFIGLGAHTGEIRENRDWAFEHARETAMILIKLMGEDKKRKKDTSVVVSALLHDTGEDSEVFGDYEGVSNSDWRRDARKEISLLFGEEVAEIVLTTTKPKVNGIDVLTKEQAREMYYRQIREGNPKAILVKMADRLHNLRTQYATPPEKQIWKIKETEEVYFPIFETVREFYPEETEYLISEMKKSIAVLKKALYLD